MLKGIFHLKKYIRFKKDSESATQLKYLLRKRFENGEIEECEYNKKLQKLQERFNNAKSQMKNLEDLAHRSPD